ncbi:MAG: stage II sporulation protein M [Candidatus Hadarchaeota archaeon]
MKARKVLAGAFERNSSAFSFVIIVFFAVMLFSLVYNTLAFTPSDFLQRPGASYYENAVENVTALDKWTRTVFYWKNNLGVVGVYVIAAPANLGFNSGLIANYNLGLSLAYWYHSLGGNAMLAFSSSVFVHGLLELTGAYLVIAASLRLAWNLWKGAGRILSMARKKGELFRWSVSFRPSSWERREVKKHREAIKLQLTDFAVLAIVGIFLVFLAAPIESYISPTASAMFYGNPLLGLGFLIVVGLFYVALMHYGFGRMLRDISYVRDDLKLAFRGKRRYSQFSLLMLVLFSVLMLTRLMFWTS